MRHYAPALLAAFLTITNATMWAPNAKSEQTPSRYFSADDVFELEWVRSPEISPDGKQVVWVRSGYDRTADRAKGALWVTEVATGISQPLSLIHI